jgi:hypothetical protein
MLTTLGLAFVVLISTAQDVRCKPGTVIDVAHGRDYTLNICGVGVVGLRGVEPPLRSAAGSFPMMRGPGSGESTVGRPTSGDILGGRNVGPEAVAFLSKLVGQRVTIVNDGYRIGDSGDRQYAYVFLPDKMLLNAQMIRLGYGYADRQGSHPRRNEFIALEDTARRSKVGVWAS